MSRAVSRPATSPPSSISDPEYFVRPCGDCLTRELELLVVRIVSGLDHDVFGPRVRVGECLGIGPSDDGVLTAEDERHWLGERRTALRPLLEVVRGGDPGDGLLVTERDARKNVAYVEIPARPVLPVGDAGEVLPVGRIHGCRQLTVDVDWRVNGQRTSRVVRNDHRCEERHAKTAIGRPTCQRT